MPPIARPLNSLSRMPIGLQPARRSPASTLFISIANQCDKQPPRHRFPGVCGRFGCTWSEPGTVWDRFRRGMRRPEWGRRLTFAVRIVPLPPTDRLEPAWRNLEARAEPSFFTSWFWIGSWLDRIVAPQLPGLRAGLLEVVEGAAIRAMAVVCRRRRGWPWLGATVALNQTGDPGDDAIWIEYNGLLAERGHEAAAWDALARALSGSGVFAAGPWRAAELRLAGVSPAVAAALNAAGVHTRATSRETCPWIAFGPANRDLHGYLATLSANSRRQIRRALELLSASGPPRLERATPGEASAAFDELKDLHIAMWRARAGHDGAFGHRRFEDFSRTLIARGVPAGAVELVRVRTPDQTVGVLLNFVHRGHVYNYQTGFRRYDDNRIKPGLASHALCIADHGARGAAGYHFMGGGGRYKDSLGTSVEPLIWARAVRHGLLSRLETLAMTIREMSSRR
ncbi:MAG: GNAT family N-acetyltransferase [Rhodospirillaceae bacterium]|nr:GNAT family N-acetyltransferase [Rhodospirillaceae bacterium]